MKVYYLFKRTIKSKMKSKDIFFKYFVVFSETFQTECINPILTTLHIMSRSATENRK